MRHDRQQGIDIPGAAVIYSHHLTSSSMPEQYKPVSGTQAKIAWRAKKTPA
jgi:hypothetical protein